MTTLQNCPFCNGIMEPFGPAQFNHPRNDCWLSSVKIVPEEYERWNSRAALSAPAAPATLSDAHSRVKAYLERRKKECGTFLEIINAYDISLDCAVELRTSDLWNILAAAGNSQSQDAAIDRDKVRDAVAAALVGNFYCGRVWSAWKVGTMREDDFTPSGEVGEVVDEITDAAIAAMGKQEGGEGA